MPRLFFLMGAVSAFLGVALGAFGAHALRNKLSGDLLNIFEVGVRYQMSHALALLAVAWAAAKHQSGLVPLAGWLFAGGILFFSGSLYAYALSGAKVWVHVTPVGGVLFLAGWLALGLGVWKG